MADRVSYYNLSLLSVCLFGIYSLDFQPISTKLHTVLCTGLICNEVSWWSSYYKMTISSYAWESGWEPHWQGASSYSAWTSSPLGHNINLIKMVIPGYIWHPLLSPLLRGSIIKGFQVTGITEMTFCADFNFHWPYSVYYQRLMTIGYLTHGILIIWVSTLHDWIQFHVNQSWSKIVPFFMP